MTVCLPSRPSPAALQLHHGTARLEGVSFPAAVRWRYGDADQGPQWRYAGVTYADETETVC